MKNLIQFSLLINPVFYFLGHERQISNLKIKWTLQFFTSIWAYIAFCCRISFLNKNVKKEHFPANAHMARINFCEKTSTFAPWVGKRHNVCLLLFFLLKHTRTRARTHTYVSSYSVFRVYRPARRSASILLCSLPFGFIIALPFAIFRGWITYVDLTWMGCEVINPVRAVCQGCYSIRLHGSHLGSIICR